MNLMDWIAKTEKQTMMIFPETLAEYIDDNFDRTVADKLIVALVRGALFGDAFEGYDLCNDAERVVFDLLYEKVGVFGESIHSEDGEENV